jgi:hypothetical protein
MIKFNNAYDVDNYSFKDNENNIFMFKLISILLEQEKEWNPNMWVSELRPSTQQMIIDMGNTLYNREMELEKQK